MAGLKIQANLCHPVYDNDGAVKCSRSGLMRGTGNAAQRAVQTPSLSPFSGKVWLLPLLLLLPWVLLLPLCFITKSSQVAKSLWVVAPTIDSITYCSHDL